MNLYNLDENIAKAQSMLYVNEDGVLQGESEMIAEYESLLLSKTDKIESLAIYHKNELAKAAMITAEIKNLQSREKAHKSKAEGLKTYLSNYVDSKMETSKVKITFRKSQALAYSEDFHAEDLAQELQTIKITPNAAAIKSRLKSDISIDGVQLVEKQNIQIK